MIWSIFLCAIGRHSWKKGETECPSCGQSRLTANVTRLKHFLGFHVWSEWQNNVDEWFEGGCNALDPIDYWRTCKLCGKEEFRD